MAGILDSDTTHDPVNLVAFDSSRSESYEPSCPVIPVISALRAIVLLVVAASLQGSVDRP
jgi:hypothetical protein